MNYWTLIDSNKDPHELKNVYADRTYTDVRKDLHAELERLRIELRVPSAEPASSGVKPRAASRNERSRAATEK
jgi:hypothetical protein